jgi:hypothetical protein
MSGPPASGCPARASFITKGVLTMTNTNCLKGIACPKCGHSESFNIEATVVLHVTDDGSEDRGGDHYWDEDSHCQCGNPACEHGCALWEFEVENQTSKDAKPSRDC